MGVSIFGMGGIGKTTLARQLYNHAAVVERFERRAWACVSSEFGVKEVLNGLIRQVGDMREEEMNLESLQQILLDVKRLQQILNQHLQGKSYFIVLDNVWDDTSVNHVLRALPKENNSSSGRVLLTSRSYNIAKVDATCRIQHMSSDASWRLFLKMVFPSEYRCPRHLEQIGRKIVKMCNGLPLAIKEVGRQLATKEQSESAWEEFVESMDFTETTKVLELSYKRSSPECKSCFLHMSFFREGTTIRAQRWIHIWNAQGIVGRLGESHEMEDTARCYLRELFRKSLIMADFTIDNKLKSFILDGFLHKICITNAVEEIGFETLENEEEHYQAPFISRHRVIYCRREKFNYATNQDQHLLSLFFRGSGNFDIAPYYWESFEQLRILDFEGFGLKSLPETVCKLSRLRYLGLRDNYIQELPHTLGRLKNLEVLDIELNFMIEVSDIIWEIDNLRHIYMSDIICRTPLKIDSLKHLQTLTYISVDNWTYELSNLEKMTRLRKLGIEDLDENSDVSKLFISMAKLKNLECLILRGLRFRCMPPLDDLRVLDGLNKLKLDGRLTKLPKFPKNIICLTLVNSCLNEDPMPELEKLSRLYCLKLKNAYTGQQMVISQHKLHSLGFLYIRELRHVRNLRLGEHEKRLLHLLEIYSCPYLDNVEEFTTNGPWKLDLLRMVATKKIAKVVRKLDIAYKRRVDIQP